MRKTVTTLLATLALLATGVVAGLAAGGTGTVDPPPRIAFLANGIVPADALAAGGIAGQLGAPLFTTPADTLNTDAAAGIDAYDPDLIIVLGGPVAITDDVVAALGTATGLAVTTADAPTDGIVRVAGGDRFGTARAVADLLAAYDPAYLPVDATALGALHADTADNATAADEAGDADTLDGLHATAFEPEGDFALADQACTAGRVVTGIAANGTPTCATDKVDGGDANTLDGLDGADADNAAATLPLGTTRTGDWGLDYNASGSLEHSTFFSFPFELSAPARIEILPVGGGPTPNCPGGADAPTAAAGWFCFYVASASNIAGDCAVSTVPFGCAATTSVRGTGIVVRANVAGRATYTGSWAVTNSEETPVARGSTQTRPNTSVP